MFVKMGSRSMKVSRLRARALSTASKLSTLHDLVALTAPVDARSRSPVALAESAYAKVTEVNLNAIRRLMTDLVMDKDSRFQLSYEDKQNKTSHGYAFINARMPLKQTPEELVMRSFTHVLGRPAITTGDESTFGTGDKVRAPDKLAMLGDGIFGRIVYTTEQHALHGFLAHFAMDIEGRSWMLRFGGGSYPLPLIRRSVEKRNPSLGMDLWIRTDHLADLMLLDEKYPRTEADRLFAAFHGEEALDIARSVQEANKHATPMMSLVSAVLYGGGLSGPKRRLLIETAGNVPRLLQKHLGPNAPETPHGQKLLKKPQIHGPFKAPQGDELLDVRQPHEAHGMAQLHEIMEREQMHDTVHQRLTKRQPQVFSNPTNRH